MKTVVAFANGRGGKIVFGIEDKTLEVVGMDEDSIYKTMDAITNAISDSCEPAIRPDVAMQTIKDKTVIVVEIFPGAERPYYIKSQGVFDGTYVRVAGTTRHVEDYMLRELMLEGKNRYFDSEICQNMDISDSEIEELCKSLKETAIRNTWQDSEKEKIKDATRNILISWGVLKEEGRKVYPTNAYALLTGRMVGQPVIQCGVFKGTNRAHFVDRREFGGSIQEQMDAAYQYVLEKINMGMTIKGMYRQDVYELPTDSIRELIDFDGDFRVNMYRKRDANTETNTETNIETNTETNTENVGRIIRLMGEQPSITVKMIAQQLGLSVGGVRYHINKLKKDGVVEHIGSSKKGTWVIHD